MRKLIFTILFLFFSVNAYSAPPSRDNTYVPATTITASDVTANEDAIFNYLQAGVDTYADNTIVNADVNSSAAIQSDKLTLTSIAQNVAITSAGSFNNNGATTLDGDVTLGDGTDDTLTINSDDGITYTPAATWTFTGNQTVSGTWADLGTITTADINGGTLDGVQIDGATTTGTIFFNDASDDVAGLVPGADNLVLTSTGTSGIPAYEALGFTLISTTTVTNATNTGNITIAASNVYFVTFILAVDTSSENDPGLRFNSSSTSTGYAWWGKGRDFATSVTVTEDGDDSDDEISLCKGTGQFCLPLDGTTGFMRGQMYIDTNKVSTTHSVFVSGSFFALDNSATMIYADFGGINQENLTVTDFEIYTPGGTFDATVKVYELR